MTNQTQAQAVANPVQEVSFRDLKTAGITAVVASLNTITNTARFAEHTTGILADKAENMRKQIAISDAVEHNRLMTTYIKEAQEAGLDVSSFQL